ncbi:hypothetical protein DL95DRAFT_392797 [Leptodontidium sp. 2 PMI_412]|nr:hypothetical protein DL95DRAFT_392797 [Leptodontidium sp. 2 PMI_412]
MQVDMFRVGSETNYKHQHLRPPQISNMCLRIEWYIDVALKLEMVSILNHLQLSHKSNSNFLSTIISLTRIPFQPHSNFTDYRSCSLRALSKLYFSAYLLSFPYPERMAYRKYSNSSSSSARHPRHSEILPSKVLNRLLDFRPTSSQFPTRQT